MVSDHDLDVASVASLHRAFKHKQAVVLLAGRDWTGFPLRVPHECRYFVLGWYAITHSWFYPEPNVLETNEGKKKALKRSGQGNQTCSHSLQLITVLISE